MKVIDLLIRIALKKYNQLPKMIKYYGKEYIWCIDVLMYTSDGTIEGEGMLKDVFIERVLNDEIEILEDKSIKIEKIDNRHYDEVNQCYAGTEVLGEKILVDKINEVIDKLNYLLEKSDKEC